MTDAESPAVRLIGDPVLRRISETVDLGADDRFPGEERALHATLDAFRRQHGFGRAVSAPQIGINKRFIAFHLDGRRFTMVNPEIVSRSDACFTLWDDCMSFPFLLVKVRRHESLAVRWTDPSGAHERLDAVDRSIAELIAHEMDHLDGILATDRAVDPGALVARDVFEARPAFFRSQVDGSD